DDVCPLCRLLSFTPAPYAIDPIIKLLDIFAQLGRPGQRSSVSRGLVVKPARAVIIRHLGAIALVRGWQGIVVSHPGQCLRRSGRMTFTGTLRTGLRAIHGPTGSMPTSSSVSRRAACSGVSPSSPPPAIPCQ